MFDVIDTLVGSLLGINPIKYIVSRKYRAEQVAKCGREARYIFRFQMAFCIAVIVLVLLMMHG